MFDNSKINHSQLSNSRTTFDYDISELEKEGFKHKYTLDPINPLYSQVISECKIQNIVYKLIPIKGGQEHIWTKE
jgi:hypothetical protein